jgi:putative DNA primase/helicase
MTTIKTIAPVSISGEQMKTIYTERAIIGCAFCVTAVTRYLKDENKLEIEYIYPYKNADGTIALVDVFFKLECFTDDRKVIHSFWYDGAHVKSESPPTELYNRELLSTNPYMPVLICSDVRGAHTAAALVVSPYAEFIPTCPSAGTKDILSLDYKPLAGRDVYLYPDDSAAARKEAQILAAFLRDVTASVSIVETHPQAKKVRSHGAGITETLAVVTPWDLVKYIKTYRDLSQERPKPPQEPAILDPHHDETGGIYEELYTFYRDLIHRGMEKKHINSFRPIENDQAAAAAYYTKGYVRFSDGLGWLVYDPKTGIFRSDVGKHIVKFYLDIMARARWDLKEHETQEYVSYAKSTCTEPGIRHVMKIMESCQSILCGAEHYDRDPYLINCQGITVDLRTGKQRPSTPADLHTKTTRCRPAKRVPLPEKYPVFAQFLIDITNRDPTMIGWLMRYFGYSLSGDTKAAYFVNLHGTGRNGKGTLMHTMQYIFADYASEIPTAIVVDNGKYHNILHSHARLLGVRLGIAADVPAGRMNIESLKTITGNDLINAEFKYKDSFSFRPVAKIILSSNEQLRLPDTGQSIKSRLRYVPFPVSFAGREDSSLEQRIEEEAPEILAMLINEAVEYFKNPGPRAFPECAAIKQKTAEYIASEDIIGQFLEECTMAAEGEKVRAGELYQVYCEWCKDRNEHPMTGTKFGKKITARGLEKSENYKGKYYLNLKIKGLYD